MSRLYPPSDGKFEKYYAFFSLWLITGAYYDAFTHTNSSELESFFTPSHAMIYSGGALLAILMFSTVVTNIRKGYAFSSSVPRGFTISLYGTFVFFVAGLGDLTWHTIFGIEQDLEAAFSATHLLLVTSFVMLMGGPFVSAWTRESTDGTLLERWPVVVSVAMMLASLSVVTQWAHPFVQMQPTRVTSPDVDLGHSLGILSMILQTFFFMSIFLLTANYRLMPVGGYTIVLFLNSLYLVAMRQTYPLLLVGILTGIVTDLLYKNLKSENDFIFRLFAVVVPLTYFGVYFIELYLFYTLEWNAHIISGAIFFPILISIILSYLIRPPPTSKSLKNI